LSSPGHEFVQLLFGICGRCCTKPAFCIRIVFLPNVRDFNP
jgi:hypothetical protein